MKLAIVPRGGSGSVSIRTNPGGTIEIESEHDLDVLYVKAKHIHELKTLPGFYEALAQRRKTFEIRDNDRDYKVGDVLRLQEWSPDSGASGLYTGRWLEVTVTYVTDYLQKTGIVVLGIEFED